VTHTHRRLLASLGPNHLPWTDRAAFSRTHLQRSSNISSSYLCSVTRHGIHKETQTERQTDGYLPSLCAAIRLFLQLDLLVYYYYYYYYYYYCDSFYFDLVIKTTRTERKCYGKQRTTITNILFTRYEYSVFIARRFT